MAHDVFISYSHKDKPTADAICAKLGIDPSLQAVAVLLIGMPDESVDAVSGASTRDTLETKTVIIK